MSHYSEMFAKFNDKSPEVLKKLSSRDFLWRASGFLSHSSVLLGQ